MATKRGCKRCGMRLLPNNKSGVCSACRRAFRCTGCDSVSTDVVDRRCPACGPAVRRTAVKRGGLSGLAPWPPDKAERVARMAELASQRLPLFAARGSR